MPLTAVVVFAVVLTALGTLQCEAATEYYVRLSHVSDTFCPGEPCHTWTEYVSHTDQYFHSNTTFWFIPGTHHMNMTLHVSNVSNISLVGLQKRPNIITNISCTCVVPPCTFAGIKFSKVTDISITMLSFEMYMYHNSTSTETTISGLSIVNGTLIKIEQLQIILLGGQQCAIAVSDSRFVMLHYIVVVGEGVGISFYKTNQSSISDCNVHPKEEGIDLLYTNSVSILHTSIIKGSTGIQMTATQNTNISYTIVRNITKFGINIINSTNIAVSSVDILFSFQSNGTSINTIYSTSTIINNTTSSNGKYGISFSKSRKAIVKETKVLNCRITGIYFYNTTDIEVKNVTTMKSSLAIYVMSSSHGTISRVVLCNCQSMRHTTDSYISNVVVKNSTLEGIYVRNAL